MKTQEPKTKEKVLALLKENANSYVSGQEIADTLFITRAGIWKAIKALREEGYSIDAINNRGYCLEADTESISESKIQALLKQTINVVVFDSIGSTNDEARKIADKAVSDDYLVTANSQTSGRGRRGRSFYSPDNTGLYMSLLLHPNDNIAKATRITCMAAVSVCRAISEVTGIEPVIKWVNDIFVNDKKIAGILSEGYTSMEDGSLSYVIVGIGINIYPPKDGFPAEIKKTAGALLKKSDKDKEVKTALCASIVNHFYDIYTSDSENYIDEYKQRSYLTGHYVKIMQADGRSSDKGYGLVLEIDDNCHLVVKYDDGSIESLSTGEVSVVKY